MRFVCEDDTVFFLYHPQSCCENVYLAEVVGNFQQLIGNPILLAKEAVNEQDKTADGGISQSLPSISWLLLKATLIFIGLGHLMATIPQQFA